MVAKARCSTAIRLTRTGRIPFAWCCAADLLRQGVPGKTAAGRRQDGDRHAGIQTAQPAADATLTEIVALSCRDNDIRRRQNTEIIWGYPAIAMVLAMCAPACTVVRLERLCYSLAIGMVNDFFMADLKEPPARREWFSSKKLTEPGDGTIAIIHSDVRQREPLLRFGVHFKSQRLFLQAPSAENKKR